MDSGLFLEANMFCFLFSKSRRILLLNAFAPYDIYLPIALSCHPMSNTYRPRTMSFAFILSDNSYLAQTLLFHLIITCMSWLQPRNEVFILY